MKRVPFTKVESVGNDFVLIREDAVACQDLSSFAIQACARSFGVGSDGLLTVGDRDGDLVMRMFNPDGSEDFCGNGLRCAGAFAAQEMGWHGDFTIWHGGRPVATTVGSQSPQGWEVSTVIGPASFYPARVPHLLPAELFRSALDEVAIASALTTGSTHLILSSEGPPTEAEFQRLGPMFETHPSFPERTSVIWAWPTGAPDEVGVRIWERGVGETLGCGTGSSAAAVVEFRRRGTGGTLKILNPGGVVTVSATAWNTPLTVSGAARLVYSGEFLFLT